MLLSFRFVAFCALGATLAAISGCSSEELSSDPKSRKPMPLSAPELPRTRPERFTPYSYDVHTMSIEDTTIDALGRIGKPAVPALIDLLHDKEQEHRMDAAKALARIGSEAKDAVPDLLSALAEESDSGVRRQIIRALGQIGPAAGGAVPALIDELKVKS